jgi:hypothetical protein
MVALVISLGLCLLACSLEVAQQRSCASDEQPEIRTVGLYWVSRVPGKWDPFTNATSPATRPGVLYLVPSAFL